MEIQPGDLLYGTVEHAGRRESCYLYFPICEENTCRFCQQIGECVILHDPSFYKQDLQFLVTEHLPCSKGPYASREQAIQLEETLLTFQGFEFVKYFDGGDVWPSATSVTFRYTSYEARPYLADEPLIIEHRREE